MAVPEASSKAIISAGRQVLREFTATLPRVAMQVRQQFLDALALAKHSEGCAASWARLFLGGR